MLSANKLLKLAESGAFSRILTEVARSGAPVGQIGPGGVEVAALGLAVGRAAEVSYELTPEIEALLGRLEGVWEERAGSVSGSTAGLVIRGLSALVELCERDRHGSAGRGVLVRARALLGEACSKAAPVGSARRVMGAGGGRAMRKWERSTRSVAGGATRAA